MSTGMKVKRPEPRLNVRELAVKIWGIRSRQMRMRFPALPTVGSVTGMREEVRGTAPAKVILEVSLRRRGMDS